MLIIRINEDIEKRKDSAIYAITKSWTWELQCQLL